MGDVPKRQVGGVNSGGPRSNGRTSARGDDSRMIAVTTEWLCTGSSQAGAAGYLPTVPADSEEPSLD